MDVVEAAEEAKKNLAKVLKKKAYTTTSISKDKGGWKATVEIIEEEHMPSQFDIIGVYEVKLDKKGKLISWNKKESRKRG